MKALSKATWCSGGVSTTGYHPQANGMIEELHRPLRKCNQMPCYWSDWTEVLPIILLGLRASLKRRYSVYPS
ncbi:hypothetical protein TNCV_3574681 [Trichonephila clavipes]|nr:hypothetical protein TNCV_3574681 [Trichonephila clavipes]